MAKRQKRISNEIRVKKERFNEALNEEMKALKK